MSAAVHGHGPAAVPNESQMPAWQ